MGLFIYFNHLFICDIKTGWLSSALKLVLIKACADNNKARLQQRVPRSLLSLKIWLLIPPSTCYTFSF